MKKRPWRDYWVPGPDPPVTVDLLIIEQYVAPRRFRRALYGTAIALLYGKPDVLVVTPNEAELFRRTWSIWGDGRTLYDRGLVLLGRGR